MHEEKKWEDRYVEQCLFITVALDMICDRPSTLAPERLTLVCLCGVTRDKGPYTKSGDGMWNVCY